MSSLFRIFVGLITASAVFLLNTKPAFALPGPSSMRPYASIGIGALYGANKSADSTTVASRKLAVYKADAVLAINWSGFILGAGAGYSFWRQLTKPVDVGNSNTQGAQLDYGPVLGFQFGSITLLGKYFLDSTYDLEKNDALGKSVSYNTPKDSYSAQLRFMMDPITYIGLEYTSARYEKEERALVTTILTEGKKMDFIAGGVICGLAF